jgi:DNA-directed RNA polymerase subunit RPC12/RpoP
MKNYNCSKCGTEIKPLVCAKCNAELIHKVVEKEGKKIHVAECGKCHGMVKAPQCCGTDMKCC